MHFFGTKGNKACYTEKLYKFIFQILTWCHGLLQTLDVVYKGIFCKYVTINRATKGST